jgi:hypothetical protein
LTQRRFRFSANYDTDTDPETTTSGASNYTDAEEGPSRTNRSQESPDLESESDPLAASFVAEGINPFEPRPEPISSAAQTLFEQIFGRDQTFEIMATTTAETKEIKLNPPKPFDGSREKFRKFLQDAELYMTINKKLYDNDLVKIGFVLSFMTEGQAAAWADQFVEEAEKAAAAANRTGFDLGTYDNFRKILKESFSAYDSPGDALSQMKSLRMKKDDSIVDHIAKFRSLVSESRIDADSPVVIDMFRETLTAPLQRRIMTLENPPTTLKGWCDWAMKIDHNWKRMQLAIGRTQANQPKGKGQTGKFYFPRRERDPNAMDIDRLSMEERNKLMKEGRCFKCKGIGHRANECPEHSPADPRRKEDPKRKMGGKDLHAHIRSLFKDMTEEEKEEFMKAAEESGF